jgi:hypothetical protein
MTTPTSGQSISFSQLRDEFGATSGSSVSLGAYRISQSVGTLSNLPLDTGVPQSGTIKSSDLYAKKLNVVIDCHSGSAETRVDARAKYDANQITIIGGFKTTTQKPSAGAGARIITNVNKQIGSAKGNRNNAALKTGQWGSGATMEIIIGSSGGIYGAGGNGGAGGGPSAAGAGQDGSSGLGIQYPTTIINQGIIRSGRGGGGGGAGAQGSDRQRVQDCTGTRTTLIGGGGGAGGSGLPAGTGGLRSTMLQQGAGGENFAYAGNGTDATLTTEGSGGGSGNVNSGRCPDPNPISGGGGAIEIIGNNPSSGGVVGARGAGGARGYAIITSTADGGSVLSLTNNGTIDGAQVNSTVL